MAEICFEFNGKRSAAREIQTQSPKGMELHLEGQK